MFIFVIATVQSPGTKNALEDQLDHTPSAFLTLEQKHLGHESVLWSHSRKTPKNRCKCLLAAHHVTFFFSE